MKKQKPFTSLINGVSTAAVAGADRGLLYGDGFFTTVAVQQGQPDLWPLHVQRLHRCARAIFGWETLPKSFLEAIEQELAAVTQGHMYCGVRITITRGVGGRGYAPPQATAESVTRLVTAFALPALYKSWQEQGITTQIAEFHLSNQHPCLAGLKTLNRLDQVMLKQELAQSSVDELLVCDAHGMLAEATAGNVFWRQGHVWYTPELSVSGVHGVVRQALLEKYPQVQLVNAPLSTLLAADEAFVCNALMQQVSIRSINQQCLPCVRNYAEESALNLAGLAAC